MGLSGALRETLGMIRFSHSVFALPFALFALVLASGGWPDTRVLMWVVVAMVAARSAAMGVNRLADRSFDAENPRTAGRHIPSGAVSRREAWLFIVASTALLLVAAWMLNPLCFFLAPVALGLFVLYAYCKRFTSLAHVVLGLCLAGAPVGAWIALRGDLGWPVVLLGLAVLFWVAGFDIFYALQDLDFDRQKGLHSIPVRLGEKTAILLAKSFHGAMVLLLLVIGLITPLGWIYHAGLAVVCALLIYEHRLVRPGDLSRLDAAFFNMNGYISVTIFLFTLVDALA